MPTINKKNIILCSFQQDKRTERQKLYNNKRWKQLRNAYLMEHPLCEECLKEQKITASTKENPLHVHHIQSPFNETNELKKWELLLDYNNLQTLCDKCHQKKHIKKHH